jgi:hypothetical protein
MLRKKGKVLHRSGGSDGSDEGYPARIAAALQQELGATHQAIKIVMRWTGASERTIKYWFAGAKAPNGVHLIALAQHSDRVLEAFLDMAGRDGAIVSAKIHQVREKLTEAMKTIDSLM